MYSDWIMEQRFHSKKELKTNLPTLDRSRWSDDVTAQM